MSCNPMFRRLDDATVIAVSPALGDEAHLLALWGYLQGQTRERCMELVLCLEVRRQDLCVSSKVQCERFAFPSTDGLDSFE